MMHPDLPVEQMVRRPGARFQFGFATEAREMVPMRDEYLLKASHKGLHVLARNEDGLAGPISVLREVYGPDLQVQAPRARIAEGVQLLEPIMHARIRMLTLQRGIVKAALRRRDAILLEEYVRTTYSVLRYKAPLADLLGLPAELARLTSDTVQHHIVLSHYAIVTRDPGGRAA